MEMLVLPLASLLAGTRAPPIWGTAVAAAQFHHRVGLRWHALRDGFGQAAQLHAQSRGAAAARAQGPGVLWRYGPRWPTSPAALVGARMAIQHGAGFVRKVFIFVVSLLILKTAHDAFLR
jgi:hypothetical protein